MKAVAVYPGQPHSLHLENIPQPQVTAIPNGRGVLVKVLRAGVDGTDKEIIEALYGQAPEGAHFLIVGHEHVGQVIEVGPHVPSTITPGAYVVATVRRPGTSLYDQIGSQDMTTDAAYYERGIHLLHGFMTEYYVEDAAYLVPLPPMLREVGVLLEPIAVVEKGINQAFEIQRRLKLWQPRRAAVIGAGAIGLLAGLVMRLRGLEVTCYSLRPPPYLNSDLITQLGGHYVCSQLETLAEVSRTFGPFDLMLEATGYSPLVFAAAEALAPNGVLVLASITGGERQATVPADKINQGFVLGNKVMVGSVSAAYSDFLAGVDDLLKAEAFCPGWLNRMLTTPVQNLDQHAELLHHLFENKDAIKVFVEVAQAETNQRTQG